MIIAAIVVVIQALDLLLGMVLGLLTVDEVQALGLSQLVNLSTGETDEQLLGELMGDRLSCEALKLILHREMLKAYPPCVVCPRRS